MAQNVYDQEDFFTQYSTLPRSVDGLSAAPEWPSLRNMIGDISDLNVLDLACGYGWFTRWACDSKAKSILGIDISQKMIAKAKESETKGNNGIIKYEIGDLDTINLLKDSYHLVYSSLAFHYIADIKRLIQQIHNSLLPGGKLVFSVEHPIYTAPRSPETYYVQDKKGSYWPLNGYADEGPRTKNWLAAEVLKQHRTIETYVSNLLEAGFILEALKEWMPSVDMVKEKPSWEEHRERPMFLLISARKA